MTTEHDDDAPLNPAESLRLIERERTEAARRIHPDPRIFLWPWGFAWLIGFTLYFLRWGPDGRVLVALPEWLPPVVLLTVMMAAGVISGVAGARSSRWISGPSSRQGMFYGFTWMIAFTGLSVVLAQISDTLTPEQAALLWPGAMVALSGALHMAGGAIYKDDALFFLGAFISVINIVGVILGPGWHALLIAVLGGGGMILAGAWAKSRFCA